MVLFFRVLSMTLIMLLMLLLVGLKDARAYTNRIAYNTSDENTKPVRITIDDIVYRAKVPIERRIKHNLSKDQIMYLKELGTNEGAWHGWKKLANYGDSYAKIALKIVVEPDRNLDRFYHRIVQINWKNTVGEWSLVNYFDSVAQQHYLQYIETLITGYWPDSFQICMSARKAADDHKLPNNVVFYGVWDRTPMANFISWQRLAGMESQRIADCQEVFRDLPKSVARLTLVNNIIGFFQL